MTDATAEGEEPARDLESVVEDLTLMLMYLTAWREEVRVQDGKTVDAGLRTWKGYDFDVLDRFHDEDWTRGSKRAKSVLVTEDGRAEARRLLEVYGLEDVDPDHG